MVKSLVLLPYMQRQEPERQYTCDRGGNHMDVEI